MEISPSDIKFSPGVRRAGRSSKTKEDGDVQDGDRDEDGEDIDVGCLKSRTEGIFTSEITFWFYEIS